MSSATPVLSAQEISGGESERSPHSRSASVSSSVPESPSQQSRKLENVLVSIRLRPPSEIEKLLPFPNIWETLPNNSVTLVEDYADHVGKTRAEFRFGRCLSNGLALKLCIDKVFEAGITTADIYENSVRPLIRLSLFSPSFLISQVYRSAMEGMNGWLICVSNRYSSFFY